MSGGRSKPEASGERPVPCPICRTPVPPDGPSRPFCSPRCKMVDLGRWFSEVYRVPGEDAVDLSGLGEEDAPGRDR